MTLQAGEVTDQVLLAGVEDMQIQIGLDTDNDKDGIVDTYVDAGAQLPGTDIGAWSDARTVQVWLVLRSLRSYSDLDTVITADIAGNTVTLPAGGINDGFRRMVVSTVAELRNR